MAYCWHPWSGQRVRIHEVIVSRIPALELERAVCERIAEAFDDPIVLATTLGAELTPVSLGALVTTASAVAGRLR